MTGAGGVAPRRKIAAGNWKMNGLLNASDMLAELQGELQTAMKTATPAPNCDIIICPPFPLYPAVWATTCTKNPANLTGRTRLPPPPNRRIHGRHIGRDAGRHRREIRHYRSFGTQGKPRGNRRYHSPENPGRVAGRAVRDCVRGGNSGGTRRRANRRCPPVANQPA